MNHEKIPATPETRNSLYENMGRTIEIFSPTLKECIILKEALDRNTTSKIFDGFLSLFIYVQYTKIELASVLRACFRANLPAEKRYNIKWVNCVILESYKHLYGYGNRKRKKSLWRSKIEPLLKIVDSLEFEQDFKTLENHIIEFGEREITNLENRDLSFHYDEEPVKVYDMLSSLDEDEEVQRMNNFLDLLQKICVFISKYKEHIPHIDIKAEATLKYALTLSDIDIFRDNKEGLHLTLEDVIQSHSSGLEKFVTQLSISEQLNQHFKDIDSDSIETMNKLLKVAIQLTYLYIDLASASKAVISSEYTIEKQLSLKKICIIIYEGYNKVYGLHENSENSFWHRCVLPIVSENENKSLYNESNLIEQELQKLRGKFKTLKRQRQLSVHLEEGIPEVYLMLHNLNPIEQYQNTLFLLDTLPRILKFLTKCLHIVELKHQINYEKRMAPTYEKIDNIISLFKKAPDSQQKDDAIKILEKFKSGDFFDEIRNRMNL